MYIYIYIYIFKKKVQDVNTLNFRKSENSKNDYIFHYKKKYYLLEKVN